MNEEFQSAVDGGDTAKVESLLSSAPGLVNDRRQFDFLALHQAVDNDDLEMVKLLLDYGANVNGVNDEGISALHLAHSCDVVHVLCDHGADVNLRSSRGWTPLYSIVCEPDTVEVIHAVIERGGDAFVPDNMGELPIDAAILREEAEKVSILRKLQRE